MDLLIRLFRNLGIAASIGLFASATATAASTALYDVEPARPRAMGGFEGSKPKNTNDANDDWERRKRRREAAVASILGRNPFCEDCTVPPSTTIGDPNAAPTVAPGTPLTVQLVATMESSEASASLATIYDPARGTWLARVGDEVEPGAVLTEIGSGRVAYVRAGAAGVLDMGRGDPPKHPRAAKPKKPGAEKPKKPSPAKSDQINCEGGGSCTVERALIDEVLANPRSLGGVRAFPSGGGFKIAGVRRGSLVHQLGLRSGDVLTEVNGRPLDSVNAALDLLPRLKNASNLSVTLSRRGKPQTHNVSII